MTAEEAILEQLAKHTSLTLDKLMQELPNGQFTFPEIKGAVWHLIHEGKIELTPERDLKKSKLSS